MEWLERTVDNLHREDCATLIMLGGNFNNLNVSELAEHTGLFPTVTEPTRGRNTLDMFMVSVPGVFKIKVLTSVSNTDLKAIVASKKGRQST